MDEEDLTFDGCLKNFDLKLGEFFSVCKGRSTEPPMEVLKRKLGGDPQKMFSITLTLQGSIMKLLLILIPRHRIGPFRMILNIGMNKGVL